MVYLMWAIILLLIGLGLVVLEAFIPSHGLLGAAAAIVTIVAIFLAFYSSVTHGLIVLGLAVVAMPTVIALALKWWPNTPIGRRILPDLPKSEDVIPDNPQRRWLRELVGKTGVAKSVMLPSGAVAIDGRIIDAVSEGMVIEEGKTVRVIEVKGTKVVVRAVEPEPAAAGEDLLSKPIDTLGLDPFRDAKA
jgi:membrane-bound serine protease (ClpP class)